MIWQIKDVIEKKKSLFWKKYILIYIYIIRSYDDDSECPMDYETSLLPNVFPLSTFCRTFNFEKRSIIKHFTCTFVNTCTWKINQTISYHSKTQAWMITWINLGITINKSGTSKPRPKQHTFAKVKWSDFQNWNFYRKLANCLILPG